MYHVCEVYHLSIYDAGCEMIMARKNFSKKNIYALLSVTNSCSFRM